MSVIHAQISMVILYFKCTKKTLSYCHVCTSSSVETCFCVIHVILRITTIVVVSTEPAIQEPLGTAPEFVVSLQPCLVKEREDAELTCQVTGEPTPELTWQLNGEPLTIDGRYTVVERDGLQVLQVQNVALSDAGEYMVTAKNIVGEATCSAVITVEGI